jgi:hypothetical protein
MVEPIAATTAIIGATMATANAVNVAAPTGGGFVVTAQGANYPSEIHDDLLVGERTHLTVRDVIKFHAEGGLWNDDLSVATGGFASSNNDPIAVYPNGQHPTIPANLSSTLASVPGAAATPSASDTSTSTSRPTGGSRSRRSCSGSAAASTRPVPATPSTTSR